MQCTCVLWLLFIVASNDILIFGVNSEDSKDSCPCSAKLNCPPKFQVYPEHSACLAKSSKAVTGGVSEDLKKEIVAQHNELRSNVIPMPVNMLKMTWDEELAMVAQGWTDACVMDATERFKHDTLRFLPGRFSVGQNLGYGQNSFKELIEAWYGEKPDYDPSFGKDASGILDMVGHYTQMVWASTNKIGCGFTQCNRRKFYVCNYAPAGNVVPFLQPYKNGTQKCADCLKCSDNLCDCGDLECANGGTLDPKTCTCSCRFPSVNSAPQCHVNCSASDLSSCGKSKPYLPTQCEYAAAACPHMCKLCSCLAATDKDGKCTNLSARTASTATVPSRSSRDGRSVSTQIVGL
ncbi:hypothetical protein BsWGS_06641 [Bradybaena similaris]